MTSAVLWTLPVPSTALLGSGVAFEIRVKRELALHFAYEAQDDSRREEAIVFQGVEAFKCTYYHARDASMRDAYDKLVDRGSTPWLEEVRANLKRNGDEPGGVLHLMINFDDGPAYEVVCRCFRAEEKTRVESHGGPERKRAPQPG